MLEIQITHETLSNRKWLILYESYISANILKGTTLKSELYQLQQKRLITSQENYITSVLNCRYNGHLSTQTRLWGFFWLISLPKDPHSHTNILVHGSKFDRCHTFQHGIHAETLFPTTVRCPIYSKNEKFFSEIKLFLRIKIPLHKKKKKDYGSHN